MRRTIWLALALLASCAPAQRNAPAIPFPGEPQAAAGATASQETACRAGPDGEARAPDSGRLADRGIGGTGIRPDSVQTADRGIGGTGIIGVVTGFASICLSGREVAFADDVPVVMDGAPAAIATLRAGQLTAVEAAGPPDGLRARRIVIRHEVSGPVEEIGADGVLRVAGQRVIVSAQTWGAYPAAVGDWIAVSGLRAPGGEIDATRIDRRTSGPVFVHGVLLAEGGRLRIGALEVRPAAGLPVTPGLNVTAAGRIRDGVLYADMLDPDLLVLDPAGYFGVGVSLFVIEGYAGRFGDRLRLGPHLDLRAPPGLSAFAPGRAIAEFTRRGDGTLAVTGLREAGGSRPGGPPSTSGRNLMAPPESGRFEPAPTPNRGIGGRDRGGAAGSGRDGRRGGYNSGDSGQRRGSGLLPDGSSADQPGAGQGQAPGSGFGGPGDMGFRRR